VAYHFLFITVISIVVVTVGKIDIIPVVGIRFFLFDIRAVAIAYLVLTTNVITSNNSTIRLRSFRILLKLFDSFPDLVIFQVKIVVVAIAVFHLAHCGRKFAAGSKRIVGVVLRFLAIDMRIQAEKARVGGCCRGRGVIGGRILRLGFVALSTDPPSLPGIGSFGGSSSHGALLYCFDDYG
jgi:hypothetical protein